MVKWRVFGHQSNHATHHRGEPDWRVAYQNGPAEDSERKMGKKQPGDYRGKKEDDAQMEGERLDKEKEKLDSQRDVPGACRCSRTRRDKRTQKMAEGGLERS